MKQYRLPACLVIVLLTVSILLGGCKDEGAALFGKWSFESDVISGASKAKYAGYEKILEENKTESMEFFNL
jgi:hypothetical protein